VGATVSERTHLSIGEVLGLLQDEFPDITISKIRFLESQGLLDPERTPSGYRKFYDSDIDRLRWILRQQRENFLPLKVIKDRLAAGELDEPTPSNGSARGDGASTATAAAGVDLDQAGESKASTAKAGSPPGASRRSRARKRAGQGSLLDTGETSVSLSLDELTAATGLTARVVAELERFGLITSRTLGASSYYDEDALVVARLAATFLARGVEPRHLRMYKVAAEREAGVFEQLVMPLLKQRNPATRQQAIETLQELTELGDQLRGAMLRQALQGYLGHG
jgi:DNA-binding transcriptional MerR regulator